MTQFIDASEHPVDKHRNAASVTHSAGVFCGRGEEQNSRSVLTLVGGRALGNIDGIVGSFSEPIDELISYVSPQMAGSKSASKRDYPWRRRAYDRTLSCPDLARAINDFLSSGVEFVSNDDTPVQLCA